MPTLNDSFQSDLSAYSPTSSALVTYGTGAAPPSVDLQPGRSSVMRCPLPPVWQASPDALRQFYINGTVPQNRLMTPAAVPVSTSSGTSSSASSLVIVNGGGGGGGSSTSPITAQQVSVTSPALAPGAKFVGSMSLSKSFQLLNLSVSSPCRVQLYGTANSQTQDINRGLDIAPAAGTVQNIICDIALDTAPYQWIFQNRVGANTDTPQAGVVYVTLTNLGNTGSTATMTFAYVPLET